MTVNLFFRLASFSLILQHQVNSEAGTVIRTGYAVEPEMGQTGAARVFPDNGQRMRHPADEPTPLRISAKPDRSTQSTIRPKAGRRALS